MRTVTVSTHDDGPSRSVTPNNLGRIGQVNDPAEHQWFRKSSVLFVAVAGRRVLSPVEEAPGEGENAHAPASRESGSIATVQRSRPGRAPGRELRRKGGLGRSGIGEIGSPAASHQQETDMQTMVFTGRLAADPQISDDFGKAVFRLLEQRGTGQCRHGPAGLASTAAEAGWSKGLNEKVIARGLAQGCEAVVIGAFIDTAFTARDGSERTAKELVINRLTVLDWAEDRQADASADAADDRAAAWILNRSS